MALTDKARRKIEEEEEHRYKAREKLKQKKANKNCLGCLALFIILVAALVAASSGEDSSNPSDQSSNQVPIETYSETDKVSFAKQYCLERKTASRLFPLLDLTETSIGVKEGNYKKGSQLTSKDCRRNVDALIGAGYETDIRNIIAGKFWNGMEKMELVTSVGSPDDINKGVYGGFTSEQWIYYKDSIFSAYYIYVDNDVVTSWQDF